MIMFWRVPVWCLNIPSVLFMRGRWKWGDALQQVPFLGLMYHYSLQSFEPLPPKLLHFFCIGRLVFSFWVWVDCTRTLFVSWRRPRNIIWATRGCFPEATSCAILVGYRPIISPLEILKSFTPKNLELFQLTKSRNQRSLPVHQEFLSILW